MRLSVIVTSYNSPETLAACLASLAAQTEAHEIVVADCSDADPTRALAARFPSVRFLRFEQRCPVPRMRWAALAHTTGEVVAAVEARCVPVSGWCGALLAAHREQAGAPAAGGPVALAAEASALDAGLYFNEYGQFAPPLASGWRDELSGANLSYKRDALEAERDLVEAGAWETWIHERWRRAQRRFWFENAAAVTFRNSMPLGAVLRQRFHYGRGYAGARFDQWAPRLAYALLSPLLPAVLMWRTARGSRDWLRSLHWQLVFAWAWSAGEAVGYLFGPPKRHDIF